MTIAYIQQQYEYICSSRRIVLESLAKLSNVEFNKPIQAFDEKSVCFLLVHTYNVYVKWICEFAMDLQSDYIEESNLQSEADLFYYFNKIDHMMAHFFGKYENFPMHVIEGEIEDKRVSATSLQLYTHVVTHEFHHKGQLMSMYRLLGKIPPDTDVIRS